MNPPTDKPVATRRTPGFDVARALAVLGMVIVNYTAKMEAYTRGPDWLVWLGERLEGRAAALFVVLAGIGISLRSRRARLHPDQHLAYERSALAKRAAVLFAAGLLNLHMWEWDILHFYGVFLAIAALLLNARGWLLWLLSAACVAGQVLLQSTFDYGAEHDFFTAQGALSDLAFNGLHPLFPWLSFLLVGMWVGRLDLNDASMRRRVLSIAMLCVVLGEALDTLARHAPDWFGLSDSGIAWLSSWPRPPGPLYVIAAAGAAIAAICLCIAVTQRRAAKIWVIALSATGQLAFTLYIAHAVAILIPLQHGILEDGSLALAIGYSFAFFGASVAASLWWRRHFPHGPLEGLIRQVTGRTSPAPWGGALMGKE